MGNINFKASMTQPNPLEVKYWVDLTADNQGGIIKYYNNGTKTWEPIQKLDTESGVTESDVASIIDTHIIRSYDGNVPSATIYEHLVSLGSEIHGLRQELNAYNLGNLEHKFSTIGYDIEDLTERVEALEATGV